MKSENTENSENVEESSRSYSGFISENLLFSVYCLPNHYQHQNIVRLIIKNYKISDSILSSLLSMINII